MLLPAFYNIPAQNIQEWVERYNGPDNIDDTGTSLAVDNSGNVYVTGFSVDSITRYDDYATIKYDASGVQQWAAIYKGPGNQFDEARAITVDASGNVYVTGASRGIGSGYDYATIKYNPEGDSVWVARYNGPGNIADVANSIKVDGSGNVYVTGYSYGNGTERDYATIKYNSAGVQQWVSRYNGPLNFDDEAISISVDGTGNSYVTGYSMSGVTGPDYLTIKYNTSGDSVWVKRYSSPGYEYDMANSLTIDGSGNVYVTGESSAGGGNFDYATIKYNSNGDTIWVRRYDGPGNSYDQATSILTDLSGNVYVTGYSADSVTYYDYATIKYNSDGNQQWVARYNGTGNLSDYAYSIALDGSGNAYVTGRSPGSGSDYDFVTIKYLTNTGDSAWVQRYNGPANSIDEAKSIAVNNSGSVFVTGVSLGIFSDFDYATIKYSTITGIKQTSSGNPEQFSLSQNYPNPFNPATKINYELKITNYVSVIVYDVLGNEVSTLVNENKPAGNYEVVFDGNNLSSGIYFYSLFINGNVIDSKRMILLK